MLTLTHSPPDELTAAQAVLDAANAKLVDLERAEADLAVREKIINERHEFLVATHKRLQDYEEQLAAHDAALGLRDAFQRKIHADVGSQLTAELLRFVRTAKAAGNDSN
jgi:N-acyl-D-aspartate/D-glutamate deacylase